jgi:ferritin-like protein
MEINRVKMTYLLRRIKDLDIPLPLVIEYLYGECPCDDTIITDYMDDYRQYGKLIVFNVGLLCRKCAWGQYKEKAISKQIYRKYHSKRSYHIP